MLRFELHRTDALTSCHLDAIIALKRQHWHHPARSQRRWFEQNVTADDRHLLGSAEGEIVAYLRIVRAAATQGAEPLPLALVDTVCVHRSRREKGLGTQLMIAANGAIVVAGEVGLLACAASLAPFYRRCAWSIFSGPVTFTAPDLVRLIPANQTILVHDPGSRLMKGSLRISPSPDRGRAEGPGSALPPACIEPDA